MDRRETNEGHQGPQRRKEELEAPELSTMDSCCSDPSGNAHLLIVAHREIEKDAVRPRTSSISRTTSASTVSAGSQMMSRVGQLTTRFAGLIAPGCMCFPSASTRLFLKLFVWIAPSSKDPKFRPQHTSCAPRNGKVLSNFPRC